MRIDKRWLIAGVAAAAVAAGSVGIATAVATDESTGPGEVVAQTQEDTQQAEDGRKTDDFTEWRHDRPGSAPAPDAQPDGERGPGDRPGDGDRGPGDRPGHRGSDADEPRGPRSDNEIDDGDVPARPERGPGDATRDERGPGAHHRDHHGERPAPQDTDVQDAEQNGAGI
ncbi:hypothetical protein [Rhodococcus coprophilus]|uniref:hypothetical protein n=1 Tax=Rhodococcus coprophilus TaxID=38310 RepID=UPI00340DFB3C